MLKKNKIILSLASIILIFVFVINAVPAYAQEATSSGDYVKYSNGWKIIPVECIDPAEGDCNINSFINLFVNLANIMYKVLPSLAMLSIIAGGFMFLTSAGKTDRIQKGKAIITTTLIGILLVIGLAWTISLITVSALTGDVKLASGEIFPWNDKFWGSGDNATDPNALVGSCCNIKFVGCTNKNNKEDCIELAKKWTTPRDPILDEDYSYSLNLKCETAAKVLCEQYFESGSCCISNTTGQCLKPHSKTGCLLIKGEETFLWRNAGYCNAGDRCIGVNL